MRLAAGKIGCSSLDPPWLNVQLIPLVRLPGFASLARVEGASRSSRWMILDSPFKMVVLSSKGPVGRSFPVVTYPELCFGGGGGVLGV
ncbi:hypothetical protein AMTR_s00151p00045720 [Amborella trichopoda]|uniref:Uncharacterized protein n=1 Tax=Amborella trichopoda TaxID=13333 RepID=W1NJZ0_AMBTC|nr:hypothetical protein AMTR_s00151p00045720 [Amborella trichopoda]